MADRTMCRRHRFKEQAVGARLAEGDVVELDVLGQRREELGADDLADLAAAVEEAEQVARRLAPAAGDIPRSDQ